MRVFLAVIAILLLTVPTYSQGKGGKRRPAAEQETEQSKNKKKRADESEKAYKAALDKIPNKPYDPWESLREKPHPK